MRMTFRLAKRRREFLQSVNNLVGGGDSTAAAAVADEGDGLGEELHEAVEAVRKVLEIAGKLKNNQL